jgi:hypothetical protein
MMEFLNKNIPPLWPGAADARMPNSFQCEILVDQDGRTGMQRLDAQFWRANVEPSERYVLSVKNSGKYRIEPGASGFSNLYAVGDWTRNGLDVGCVEAAALSGKLAAQAIKGR